MPVPPLPVYLSPDQLCIGVFVQLELNWLEHDFARGSFKISTAQQLAQIRQLGLQRIRVDPERSDAATRPAMAAAAAGAQTPGGAMTGDAGTGNGPDAENDADTSGASGSATAPEPALQAQRERAAKIERQRLAMSACEAQFAKAAGVLREINTNLFARPADAALSAGHLVQQMLDTILSDQDIAVHLMNDKSGGEELYFHSLNVTVLAVMLGRALGLAPEELRQLGIGCLFHDIGKRDIPDRVRNKTEALNRAERNLMQQHPTYGVAMAEKLQLPVGAVSIVAQHHEFADGSGYPHGLKGAQIAPLARIAAIVNTYDDLCNQHGLHEPLTPFEALAQMFAQQRQHFDAAMLNQFIRCMGVYPPGTIVELSNSALGMVVSISSANPLRPTIVLYDPSIAPSEAMIVDLESEPALSIKATLKPAQLPREVHDYLSPRKHATYFFSAGARPPSAR